jgi:hypothetical protein
MFSTLTFKSGKANNGAPGTIAWGDLHLLGCANEGEGGTAKTAMTSRMSSPADRVMTQAPYMPGVKSH